MAYKKHGKRSGKTTVPKPSKDSEAKKKLLERVLERAAIMIEADSENRSAAMEDIRFVNEPGRQWDTNMKQERGDRPCLEFNTLRVNGKRVINEIRANRPQGHVRAVEGGDKEGAELREGLVRNILNMSDFESITDYEAEYQVDGGLGAWRVDTDYADDSMFDQDILVNPIKNPFCLYWDPACKDLLQKRDAQDWLLIDRISVDEYESEYGDAEKLDFDASEDYALEDWEDEETVRVCEYWYKEPYDKELWLVELPKQDGQGIDRLTVDSTSDEAAALTAQGIEPIKTRVVHCHKIMMCVASGKSILKGPVEVGGAEFPFIVAHGEVKVVDGKVKWWGLHRFSKDSQQVQNVFMTAAAETVAGAPKAHTWATVAQAEGHVENWAEAHRKNFPIRLYNNDQTNPGPPVRHPGAEVPVAMMEMVSLSAEMVRSTSGLHEASFGEESQEKSGVALARKQRQAQIVTYNFPDNMAKAAKRTGEVILDRIPIVYDAERELRILGVDGAEDYARVNQLVFDPATGKTLRVNDLTSGKYDFYVKTGPSYSSLREEAAEIYPQLYPPDSPLYPFVADLVAKLQDHPFSDDFAERLRLAAPPQVQQLLAEGKDIPPEIQAARTQLDQAKAMVDQKAQLVQQAAQEVQQDQAKSVSAKAAAEKVISQIDVKKAEFERDVAKVEAQFAKREAALAAQKSQVDGQQQQNEAGSADLSEAQKAVAQIDAMVAKFMEAAAQILQQIDAQKGMTIAMPKKARVKSMRMERDKMSGAMIGIPEYDGQSDEPRIARVVVKDGVGVPEYEDQMHNGAMPMMQ